MTALIMGLIGAVLGLFVGMAVQNRLWRRELDGIEEFAQEIGGDMCEAQERLEDLEDATCEHRQVLDAHLQAIGNLTRSAARRN